MKRRFCKATPNRNRIERAEKEYQLLWNEMSSGTTSSRLDEILSILETLPKIHKKAIFVRNRKGVCVETK